MLQLAGDEMQGRLAQPVRVTVVVHQVPAGHRIQQTLVHVHARAGLPRHRLGQEGAKETVLVGHGLGRDAGRHRAVGQLQARTVAHVQFVLALRHFMVKGVDDHTHLGQRLDNLAPNAAGDVDGDVEVAGLVQWLQGQDLSVLVPSKQEKLQLGCNVVLETHAAGPFQLPLQDIAGIAGEGIAVGQEHIADDPGRTRSRLPWNQREGGGIGHQVHVVLDRTRKPLDGTAVEPLAVVHHLGPLPGGNGDLLDLAFDVAELEPDEVNPFGPKELSQLLVGGCGDGLGHGSDAETKGVARPYYAGARSDRTGLPASLTVGTG